MATVDEALDTGGECTTYDEPQAGAPAVPLKSPSDYRIESIAHALDAAYARASQLELTADEASALAEDFPDEAFRLGAGGDDDLIYIEHAYLRQRLNKVLGVGASVPIRRREWSEQFQYWKSFGNNRGEWKTGIRIYVDLVLIVRGCVVGEAIGDAIYYPDNAKTNYSDALESAKSNAFRRCCKEFGIGLQAWMKGWVDGWKERNTSGRSRTDQPPKRNPPPENSAKPNFQPPPGWPNTAGPAICAWLDKGRTVPGLKVALGMFAAEPGLYGNLTEWEPVIEHVAKTYKRLTNDFTAHRDEALEAEITKHLEKVSLDKAGAETFQKQEATT